MLESIKCPMHYILDYASVIRKYVAIPWNIEVPVIDAVIEARADATIRSVYVRNTSQFCGS